jgi:hypothetical protein
MLAVIPMWVLFSNINVGVADAKKGLGQKPLVAPP